MSDGSEGADAHSTSAAEQIDDADLRDRLKWAEEDLGAIFNRSETTLEDLGLGMAYYSLSSAREQLDEYVEDRTDTEAGNGE